MSWCGIEPRLTISVVAGVGSRLATTLVAGGSIGGVTGACVIGAGGATGAG